MLRRPFLQDDRHLTRQLLKSPREKNNWKSELPCALKAIALAFIFFCFLWLHNQKRCSINSCNKQFFSNST